MTTPHKATPEQWAVIASDAADCDLHCLCLLELRDRLAATESEIAQQAMALAEVTAGCVGRLATAEQRIQELISANEALRDRLSVLEEGYDELAARLETVETGKRSQLAEQGNRQGILDSSPAPAGGLVERVACAVCNVTCTDAQARAAILAVAEWLDTRGQHGCSLWLREEVQRNA